MRFSKSLFLPVIIITVWISFQIGVEHPAAREVHPAADIQSLIDRADSLLLYNQIDSGKALADIALEEVYHLYGENDTLYAKCLNTQGQYYLLTYNYEYAESCFNQALAIQERVLPPDHLQFGLTLKRLGYLYWIMARYNEAERLFKRALLIYENAYREDTPGKADILFDLFMVLSLKGDYKGGREAFYRAKIIYENNFPEDPIKMALVWGGLAYCADSRVETLALYKKTIQFLDSLCGPFHPWTAIPQYNSGAMHYYMGNYAEAESSFVRVLKLAEVSHASDHGLWGGAYKWLGDIYFQRGDYARAEKFYVQALDIFESIYGHKNKSMVNLADLYGSMGEYQKAAYHYAKDWEKRYNYIQYAFSATSEKQKMRYMREFPIVDDSHLSLCLIYNDQDLRRSALEMVLKSKGIILDALAAEKEAVYCAGDKGIQSGLRAYSDICGEIANISLAAAGATESDGLAYRLKILQNSKDSLEEELSRNCLEFKNDIVSRDFNVDDIAILLPDDVVLWEFFKYTPYDFKKIGASEDKFGRPRYMAFTLNSHYDINVIDIGEITLIDSLISECRGLINSSYQDIYSGDEKEAEKSLGAVTSLLYEYLVGPLIRLSDGKKRFFISPEGMMNLMPLEIILCPDGRYVLEKYQISYLSSGRDLLKSKNRHNKSGWALILANPDYFLSERFTTDGKIESAGENDFIEYSSLPARGASNCLDCLFVPLNHSEKEMELIAKELSTKRHLDVKTYSGSLALEEVIKGIKSVPNVLHLSTHGFFCADQEFISENPLLRSGLALAGANGVMADTLVKLSNTEDGVLTALEVSSLNLLGTELVALSACETGVGDIKNSEGVYGLRRAFQLAGAQSILMSLWSVPDKQTVELMQGFYEGWLAGSLKSEALRKSALDMLSKRRKAKGCAHPVFWGGFILTGNPD